MSSPIEAAATSCWCYRCNRFVRVPADGGVVCPDCETGFVELVETPPRLFPSSAAVVARRDPRHRRSPAPAVYMFHNPSMAGAAPRSNDHTDAGFRRPRRAAAGERSAFNPVIVLRGPSDGNGGTADADHGGADNFEFYYDDGTGSGLRPLPPSVSDLLIASGFDHLLDHLSQMEINGVGGRGHEQPPASKAAVESMPTIEIAEGHVGLDTHCAVCKDPFLLGTKAREMPCKHIFHQYCILPWLSVRNSCPVCRHELPTDVRGARGAQEADGGEQALAGGTEEDTVGLTIWRLPGGGFAVGRFVGGRRAGLNRELPVVYTEVDGGFNTGGTPMRISWTARSSRSREGGRFGRVVRHFFSFFGRLRGSSSSSSRSSRTASEPGSATSRRSQSASVFGGRRNSRRRHIEDSGGSRL